MIPVVTLPEGASASSPGVRGELRELEAAAAARRSRARASPGYGSTGDRRVRLRGRPHGFRLRLPAAQRRPVRGQHRRGTRPEEARRRDRRSPAARSNVTGYDALYDSSGEGDEGPGLLLEAIVGGVGALIVLIFVFGSPLALVPLAMAICSILTRSCSSGGSPAITDVSPIVQFLVALIGLGVSIDYALIIVWRWREEIENGLRGDEAVTRAMATAGRAVVFSGTTVAVGLLALIVLPLPFLRSMGYGGMLIPLVATAVAITLLPVILATIGPRMDRRRIKRRDRSQRFWQSWSEGVVRHRWAAVFASLHDPGVPALHDHGPESRQRRSGHDRQGGVRQGRASRRSRTPASARARWPPPRRCSRRATPRPSSQPRRVPTACTARWRRTSRAWQPQRQHRGHCDTQRGRRHRGRPRHGRCPDRGGALRVPGCPRRRHRPAGQGLRRRGLRRVPADDRADLDPDLPAPGARLPLAGPAR